jgi:branched-chain amino acid transport system ATP-binding protein
MLRLENVSAAYGAVTALYECSLKVAAGELVTLLGANGAGKTTVLHAIAGFVRVGSGDIVLEGTSIANLAPDKIVRAGLSLVPEHRQLFPEMSVEENLMMGRFIHGFSKTSRVATADMFDLFPELIEKRKTPAAMLSGGQQQMLAIGRALMAKPRILLLDEPSIGLAPLMVDRILAAIRTINRSGVAILLVEQNAYRTLPISSYAYVLESGRMSLSGSGPDVMADPKVKASYLGTL